MTGKTTGNDGTGNDGKTTGATMSRSRSSWGRGQRRGATTGGNDGGQRRGQWGATTGGVPTSYYCEYFLKNWFFFQIFQSFLPNILTIEGATTSFTLSLVRKS